MPAQRKVFRIEQTGGALPAPVATPQHAALSLPEQQEILAELKALHALIENRNDGVRVESGLSGSTGLRELKSDTDAIQFALNRTKQEIAVLLVDAFGPPPARVTRELDAVLEGAERATQQILNAAEDIEDAASTLSASLKQEQELSLALDIQDNVLRIIEACNFQDLAGQRVAKVLATLKFVEERIAHMVALWGGIDDLRGPSATAAERGPPLHGPKLEGDPGHVSQEEVDALFATG